MISPLPQISMPLLQIYFILYPPNYASQISKVIQSIQKTYATFRAFHINNDLSKAIPLQYQEIKLTKIKKTFAVLAQLSNNENPEFLPQGGKKIRISDKWSQDSNDILLIENCHDSFYLEEQLIKRLQLDSVWVGLLYRIGTDVGEFQHYLVSHEHFQQFEVSFLNNFYELIENKLSLGSLLSLQLLKTCKLQLQNKIQVYSQKVEDLVRSKFNSRILIKDITMHPYINLLQSRSYFNLIFIEGQLLNRFQTFKRWLLKSYPNIYSILTLESFILLDDYIYSEFIFDCLKMVKKFINRTLEQQPYSELVRNHHRDIIKEFRPSFHENFLNICLVLKQRAACLKEAVGAVIVKNRTIISTGYNGTPIGTINCYNGGCQVCNNSEKMGTEVLSCRCIHAEYNCILTAGITQTPGATLYSSKLPCLWCAKLIIQGRIKDVIYIRSKYHPLEHQNIQLVKRTFHAGNVYLRQMDICFNG